MKKSDSALTKMVVETGDARDYFNGVRHGPLLLPDNIVCFSHRHVASLHAAHHCRFMLLQNTRGDGIVCVDANMFPLPESHAMLIFPFRAHYYPAVDDASGWLFTSFEISEYSHLEKLRNRVIKSSARSASLTRRLLRIYNGEGADESSGNRLSLYTGLLLEQYMASARKLRTDKLATTEFSAHQQTMRKLQRLIFQHIGEPVSITDLAAELSLSESHLRLLFRSEFHTSLGYYIRDVKMTRACHLLATRNGTVTAIADACGYETVYSFSRAFKTHYGISPREYRKNGFVES